MVLRGNDKIGYWHEPPYTQQELEDFWRRYGTGLLPSLALVAVKPAKRQRQHRTGSRHSDALLQSSKEAAEHSRY
jgi:hypothetical protein